MIRRNTAGSRRSIVERDSAAEYFFSLADDAASVILADPLRENVPRYSWRIQKEEEVKPDERIERIFSPQKADSGKENVRQASSVNLFELNSLVADCHECDAWMNRPENMMAGQGALHPLIVFVVDRVLEDGSFFLPQERAFFDKWMSALHLDVNKECHFTSVIKCPLCGDVIYPGCERILLEQLRMLSARVVMMLGSAGCFLVTGDGDIFKARSKVHTWNGFRTVCSFSPAQVLSDYQNLRRPVWEDLKKAAIEAGLKDRLG